MKWWKLIYRPSRQVQQRYPGEFESDFKTINDGHSDWHWLVYTDDIRIAVEQNPEATVLFYWKEVMR